MARSNEVEARVRVTVGGVEASKKNLDALKVSADSLREKLSDMRKELNRLKENNDLTGAAKAVEDIRKTETALKTTQQTITTLEQQLKNYENVMENLSGSTLQKLNVAARDLANQMKQQVTADDIDRWKKLSDAYKEVMRQIEQLNGKAPNLSYVMQNLGTVSEKSLKDTSSYLKNLIADADKGSERLKNLQQQLEAVQAEQQTRLQANAESAITQVAGGSFTGSSAQAKSNLAVLTEYKDTLNLSTQQQEIERVTQAMRAYEEAMGKVKETAVDVGAVLSDPKTYSIQQIEDAVKQLENELKQIPVGDTDRVRQTQQQIDTLKEALSEMNFAAQGIDEVVLKAQRGEASVSEMEQAIAALNDRMKRTPQNQTQEMERMRQQLDVLNPALDATTRNMERVNAVLGNLNGANLNSLREAASALEKEMKSVNYNMDNFVQDSARLKQVRARIKELEGAWSNTASQMDNAISRLKNWVLIYAGWSEIGNKMRAAVDNTLSLSDAMSDVQKTTGLSVEEVAKLTDRIQSFDTRVSNQKLMEAAAEAGRIGLSSLEDVEKFTRSSSIVLTALEELDSRSIGQVMKLNDLLGVTEKMGVDNAILSTASAINALSQASAAAPEPIINFSRRFGGIASQAHISTSEVLALGATLDALGQPIEMSSTALNKFTTALLSNGKQIAQDTGLNEDYIFQMTRQGKTIELMIEVLSKLNTMGGIGEISKYMGDMGGDGARMAAVISSLASNLDFLREQIDLSNVSFAEGTSVIDEYNVKNENAAAIVERIGNRIGEAFSNSTSVAVLTDLVKALQQFVYWITSGSTSATVFNNAMLLVFARMLGGIKIIQSFNRWLTISFTMIRTGGLQMISFSGIVSSLIKGVKSLGAALKTTFLSNPFGWVLVGISLLSDLVSSLYDTEESVEQTATTMERVNSRFQEAEYEITQLRDALEEARESGKGYSEIVSKLNRDYGKYLGYIVSEAAGYRELAGAIELAATAQRKRILEEEKANNLRTVQDKYRDQINAQIKNVKDDLFEEFSSVSPNFSNLLYQAINKDLQGSAITGSTASLGESVRKVIETEAKALTNIEYAGLKPSDKQRNDRINQWIQVYTNLLKGMDSVKELAESYTKRMTELREMDEDANVQLDLYSELLIDQQGKQIKIIEDEQKLMQISPKDYTAANEKALDGVIALEEEQLSLIDKAAEPEKWNEAYENLKEKKNLQREVLLAFVENPLKGIQMQVGDDGKLYKVLDQQGRVQYEAVQKLSDAQLRVLVDAYRRADENFQQLLADGNNLTDSKVRQVAGQLSKVKTAINNELKKNGLDIDDKYNLKLRDTEYNDGSDSALRKEENAMKKAYNALLQNLEEYFEKQKQLVNKAYLDYAITAEQKNRSIDEIERAHQQTRINMQEELLGEGEKFNEQAYIRDLTNYKNVQDWMLKNTHHFQDQVRADMQKTQSELQQMAIAQRDEMEKLLLDRQYRQQVDNEMRTAFEKTGLFWGDRTDRSEENSRRVLDELRKASEEVYSAEQSEYRKRLEANAEFGEMVAGMNEQQYQAFLILLQQYHDKVINADKRFADERMRIINQQWEEEGYKDTYDQADKMMSSNESDLEFLRNQNAIVSDQDYYDKVQNQILARVSLEEWKYEKMRELYDKNNATQSQYEELEREHLSKMNQYQQSLLQNYADRYQQMAEVTNSYGEIIGNGLGNIVAGQEDAGKELLKSLLKETVNMAAEYTKRMVLQSTFGGTMLQIKQTQYQQQIVAAYAAAAQEVGIEAEKMAAIQAIATGEITAQSMAQPDSVLTFGASGAARAAVIIGLVTAATAAAMALINSLFPEADTDTSSKRLAAGMLTYANGRYPVTGDDGQTYDARYEPTLQTRIYDGGNGKAHMALFSEKMPEMVVSGPTTRIIRQNYPELLDAIYSIERHGRIRRSLPVYADGNVGQFVVPGANGMDSSAYVERMSAMLEQTGMAIERLNSQLSKGIQAKLNMYGKDGLKENLNAADRFYSKNKIN